MGVKIAEPFRVHEMPRGVDYLKQFTSLRVATFDGVVRADVEAWFHQLDAAFRQLETPES